MHSSPRLSPARGSPRTRRATRPGRPERAPCPMPRGRSRWQSDCAPVGRGEGLRRPRSRAVATSPQYVENAAMREWKLLNLQMLLPPDFSRSSRPRRTTRSASSGRLRLTSKLAERGVGGFGNWAIGWQTVTQRVEGQHLRSFGFTHVDGLNCRGSQDRGAPSCGGLAHTRYGALRPGVDTSDHVGDRRVRERGDDAEPELRIVGDRRVERPVDRSSNVVELQPHALVPDELVGAFQTRARVLRERGIVLGVSTSPVVCVSGLVEALPCVGPKRLQHRIPGAAVGGTVADRHGFRDEAPKCVDDVPPFDVLAGGDGFGSIRVKGSGKGAEPSEDALFGGRTQRVGPVHRRPKGLVPFDCSRRPPVKRRKRSSSRVAISWGLIEEIRATASSIASGTPSSRRHTSPTATPVDVSSSNVESTARARSTNKRAASHRISASRSTDGSAIDKERSARMCSPSTASPSRLVARMRTSGASRSTTKVNRAAASRRCSQLSSTTSMRLSRTNSLMRASMETPGRGCAPSAVAMTSSIASGSCATASSQSHAPSGK